MDIGHTMTTLSEAMNHLYKKGYKCTFEMRVKGFTCRETNEVFKPENLIIKEVFRFEGESNPDDMAVLYAIESSDGTKGLFIDAYGTYSNNEGEALADFMKKVKIEKEH